MPAPDPDRLGLPSTDQVGAMNRGRVVQALRDHGPLSRADLAEVTGASRAALTGIVQSLIDAGLVTEQEARAPHGRGKPARPVWFASGAGLSAVANVSDVGLVRAAVVSLTGDTMAEREAAFDPAGTRAAALGAVRRAVRPLVQRFGPELLGVCASVPGLCDASGTVTRAVRVPALEGAPLGAFLAAETGLVALVENDTLVEAVGEAWFGAGRGVRHFAALHVGEGLGATIVRDGHALRTAHGFGAELGHVCVDLRGARCPCGRRGCWETVAGLAWLRDQAAGAGLPAAQDIDAAGLVAAADAGSRPAARLLDRFADHLGIGVAVLAHVVGPERVILRGHVVGGGERLRQAVAAAASARILPEFSVEVVLSQLQAEAPLLGGAGLVLSRRFNVVV
jgi:predicted NBD/HSP70 family sugar kinase